jgi:hypothetical protein
VDSLWDRRKSSARKLSKEIIISMRYFQNKESGLVLGIGDRGEVTVFVELVVIEPAKAPVSAAPAAESAAGGGEPPKKVGRPKKAKHMKQTKRTPKPTKKGGHRCSKCGELGHNAKTCGSPKDDDRSVDAADAIDKMSFKPILPEQLLTAKKMLGNGASTEEIATETGLDEDRIEKIRTQLGL